MRRQVAFFVLLMGCAAPSEHEVQAAFHSFVASHNRCERDEDCALMFPGCPLGCYAAVHRSAVEEAEQVARGLIADYEAPGRACFYQCIADCGVRCAENVCAPITDCQP